MNGTSRLATPRLDLIPATASLLRAEAEDPGRFLRLLGVRTVEGWPPEDLADALPFFQRQLARDPALAGWYAWYWVLRRPGRAPDPLSDRPAPGVLVGSGGFKGPPEDGGVEIGYHVREPHRRRGYASEALHALLNWAFAHAEVDEVVAETSPDNIPSIRLLEKLGFVRVGSQPGLIRFAARRGPRIAGPP
jgi:RimJ/RimL family protein N-acetyltransferase